MYGTSAREPYHKNQWLKPTLSGGEAPQSAPPKQKDPLRPALTHEDEATDDRQWAAPQQSFKLGYVHT